MVSPLRRQLDQLLRPDGLGLNLLCKVAISQSVCFEPRDLIGLYLLYSFRLFEKRYGSRKFAVSAETRKKKRAALLSKSI